MSSDTQHGSRSLEQTLAYLCEHDLEEELQLVLQELAIDNNCDGLFLLRIGKGRLPVQIEAMYQSDTSIFSKRDAELLLSRVANNRHLHSYTSLREPAIVEDVAAAIDDDDSRVRLNQAKIRSVLLLPVGGIKQYIFGAYRYNCEGHWPELVRQKLLLAGNLLGLAQEVTHQRLAAKNNELVCIEHLYRLPIPCVHVGADDRVIRFNQSASETLRVETLQRIESLVPALAQKRFLDTMNLVKDQVLEQSSCEVPLKFSPNEVDSKVTFLSLSGEDGPILMLVEPVKEVVEVTDEQRLSLNFDSLTGLPNRAYFEAIYDLSNPCDCERATFVGFINIDRFQIVNNVSGHRAGDHLLCQLASRLSQLVRKEDVVARLSGDEFGILMPNIDGKIAEQVAERICQALANHEFSWEGRKHCVSVSMGVARCESDIDSISDLLRRASAACRLAKEKGGNAWYFYSAQDPVVEKLNTEMSASVDIIGALANDRFELFYQPIEPLSVSDEGLHLEILLRMRSADGELIAPGIFLPAAERFNLVAKLDRWVIDKLLRWGSEHIDIWQSLSMVSVNLSALSIGDSEFINWLEMRLLGEPELVAKLCFEITETAAVSQLDQATELISMVKPMGCKLALDDFGSGFSSFAYLKLLDVDYVKIDGQFILQLCDDRADQAIVSAICQLGRDMDFEIVAEFVESVEVAKHLARLGVEYGQGYGIARPTSLATLSSGEGLHWYRQLYCE
ncbi:EAL domain-containing protein [Shewanella marisflavi]|uniref:putative bifunctional diguanylate cyclase/phosphodiesterase n=1 Tax=Shewanella marisflavi TaxID=260364 RepID=UPI00200FC060|nr:EAL domain-containing protein [Shewanella marisflavi]MCL1040270.1 EAL domain-containing protein [Shewanella marisflavi]